MATSITISGVASYRKPAVLQTSKSVNLIYGLNGSGKSTLSNFLYNQDDPEYGLCSTSIDSATKVLVYNQKFVQDYFYEVEGLKGIFGLSRKNKEIDEKIAAAEAQLLEHQNAETALEAQIQSIEQAQSEKLAKAAERTWKIRRDYSGGDRVLEFCLEGLKGKKETLFSHIQGIEKPPEKPAFGIEKIRSEAELILGDAATAYTKLSLLDFDCALLEQDEVFERVIVGNEDSPVAGLISELSNSDWVSEGLTRFVVEPTEGQKSKCPFCQEETLTTALVQSIRDYFDKSYAESLSHIQSVENLYQAQVDGVPALEVFESAPLAAAHLPVLRGKLSLLRTRASSNIHKIRHKREAPSAPVALEETSSVVAELNELISEINVAIDTHNERITNQKTEKARLKTAFWSLMRWDYDLVIADSNEQQTELAEKLNTEKQKLRDSREKNKAQKDAVAKLQKQTVNIDGAVDTINRYLEQLGISDFSIAKHSDNHYRLARSGGSEAAFESLSEGEKMIISFFYFCELCRGKESAEETSQRRVAVIDDPVSSLSHIFVFNIGQLLKSEFFNSDLFDQVFVLTHSLYFFYELADANHERREENQNLFRISKSETGSSIEPMKYEQIQNDYQSYWAVALDSSQPPALIANCMRNIVEHFFGFVQKSSFADVFQKAELKQHRFEAFSRYMNRESHSFGQNLFDLKEFDYESFREGLKLLFYEAGYPEHFDKMAKTILPVV